MKLFVLLSCVAALLSCSKPTGNTMVPKQSSPVSASFSGPAYSLEVTFDGLIVFSRKVVAGNPAVWALLVDADYDPSAPDLDPNALPLCALDQVAKKDIPEVFPPHIPALRIKNADIELNGVPLGGIVPLFFLKGLDIRFDTGKKNPVINISSLASRSAFGSILGQSPDNFKHHDVIKKDYVGDFSVAIAAKHLAARTLIDFGDNVKSESCPSPIRKYGMKLKVSDICRGSAVPLAESVKVSQSTVLQDVKITLDAQRTLSVRPHTPGGTVSIEVLDILPSALADPHYNGCKDPHLHPAAFRWYYRLLDDSATAGDCTKHFFPCLLDGVVGGTKCPQIGVETP